MVAITKNAKTFKQFVLLHLILIIVIQLSFYLETNIKILTKAPGFSVLMGKIFRLTLYQTWLKCF